MLHDAILSDNAQAFIETYDKMQPCIPSEQPSISDEDLKRKIKCQIFTNNENGIPYAEILKLKEELYYYSSLCCSEAKKYFSIIHCISYLRSTSDSFIIDFNNSNWKEAISNIESYIRMDPHCGEIFEFDDAAVLSESAKNLINIGASISLKNGRLIIDNPDDIESIIIEKINSISIFSLYERMLSNLNFHPKAKRLISKTWSNLSAAKTPYNYIFHLSKHCLFENASTDSDFIDKSLILVKDFTNIVYPTNQNNSIKQPSNEEYKSGTYITSFINQYNYYDIKQANIDYVIAILDYLNRELNNHLKLTNYDLNYIIGLAKIIKENSKDKSISQVEININVPPCEKNEIIFDANEKHSSQPLRAFFKIGESHYCLPTSIAAGLLLKAGIAIIERRCSSQTERAKLGNAYDAFIKHLLDQHSIKHIDGHYSAAIPEQRDGKNQFRKVKGESDLIVEEDSHIFLIEIKKRIPSENEGFIEDYRLFPDLAEGLLKSFYQNIRTHYALIEKKELSLKDKSKRKHLLKHNNRKIIKISLALGDFSTMNGTRTSIWLVDYLQRYSFSLKWDSAFDYENIKCNMELQYKIFKKTQTQIRKFRSLPNMTLLYRDNIFISFEHLYHIIKLANNISEFASILSKLPRLSMQSDVYADIYATHLFREAIPENSNILIMPAIPPSYLLTNN